MYLKACATFILNEVTEWFSDIALSTFKRLLALKQQIIFGHISGSMHFDKGGGGVRLSISFPWEWCVVQEQRSTMVILLQLEESFGSPLNPWPQAKTTFSSLCKC